jgi:hypothetical protein
MLTHAELPHRHVQGLQNKCLGLPPMYSHPSLPLSVHYALNLCYRAQKPASFTLCSERATRPVRLAFSRILILLLLCSSGDVEVNPGPAVPSSTPTPQVLSFVDFCNRKSLGFMHVNIRSLLPTFVELTALAHSANLDVLAVCKTWHRKTTKNPDISIANYNIFQDRTAKGGGVLQSTAKIACIVLYYYPSLYSNSSSFYF